MSNPDVQKVAATPIRPLDDVLRDLKYAVPEAFPEGDVDFEAMRIALGLSQSNKERFSFNWAGKREAIHILQAPALGALAPDTGESVNFDEADNVFIEGDNLEVLRLLYKSYANRVKLVYIDPPYNTNTDRVYRDSFSDQLKNYLAVTQQSTAEGELLTSNPETGGRKHSAWLSMMYPRLFLARQILSDEGVICVSIDDNEIHNLRLLMNEIFGEENFAAQISVINNPKGRGLRENFAVCHDYLLVYTRTALSESIGIEKTPEQIEREYPNIEGERRFRTLELRNTHRQFNRETRHKLWYPIYVNPSNSEVSLDKADDYVEVLPLWDDGLEGCWTWGRPAARRDVALLVGRKIEGRWKIFRKAYSEDEQGNIVRKKLQTVWSERRFHTEVGQEELEALIPGRVFDSPKPVGLLKQIVDACTRIDEGDIVLDFFAGSATTGHATMALNAEDGGNRRFVLVQFPERTPDLSNARKAGFETISQISRTRLRKAIEHLKAQPESLLTNGRDPSEFGFRAFRLTASNFMQWQSSEISDADKYAETMALFNDPLLPGWIKLNVVFEVLEREGYSLTSRISDAANAPGVNRVYDADDDRAFWITLSDRVSLSELQKLGVGEDDLVICRDIALDDTTAANIALQYRLRVI